MTLAMDADRFVCAGQLQRELEAAASRRGSRGAGMSPSGGGIVDGSTRCSRRASGRGGGDLSLLHPAFC